MFPKESITNNSIVELHKVEHYEDDDNFIIVRRVGTSDYLSLDKDTFVILQTFSEHRTIEEVAEINSKGGYTVNDILEFVDILFDVNYIKKIDNNIYSQELFDSNTKKNNTYAKLLFNKFAWIVYLGSIVANLFFLLSFKNLQPKGSDFFVSDSGIISIIIIIISTWIVIFFHEYGHICAAKSVGISSKIKWGYRLVFLVLETDVTNIWSVPRRKRYGVYLAGLAWTSISIFLCLIMQFFITDGIGVKILKFMVLMQLQTIVFQSLLFLRTDLYYVLTNFLKIDDLNESMQTIFKNILKFNFSNVKMQMSNLPSKERNILKFYSFFSIIGIMITLYLFFIIDLPIALYSVEKTIQKTLKDPLFSFSYWDGIAMGTLTLCPLVILVAYFLLDMRKKIRKEL